METVSHRTDQDRTDSQSAKNALVKLALVMVALAGFGRTGLAQTGIRKLPGITKKQSPLIRQNFTGVIRSLNKKRRLLTVRSASENDTEFFSLTHRVHISSANGKKLSRKALIVGMSVMVNFSERNGRRTVLAITVLENQESPAKKKRAHSL